uniref:Tumor necrosis factor n=1 Tax=Ciona savignyi TaxID=51511 RepID=B4XXY2_CIOSA|nr:tumor necrosis factor [Ciona savignyi]
MKIKYIFAAVCIFVEFATSITLWLYFSFNNKALNEEILNKSTQIQTLACNFENANRLCECGGQNSKCSVGPGNDGGSSNTVLYNENKVRQAVEHQITKQKIGVSKVMTEVNQRLGNASYVDLEKMVMENTFRKYLHVWNTVSGATKHVKWETKNGAGSTAVKTNFTVKGHSITIPEKGVYTIYLHATFKSNATHHGHRHTNEPRKISQSLTKSANRKGMEDVILMQKKKTVEHTSDLQTTLDSHVTVQLSENDELIIDLEAPNQIHISNEEHETYFGMFMV